MRQCYFQGTFGLAFVCFGHLEALFASYERAADMWIRIHDSLPICACVCVWVWSQFQGLKLLWQLDKNTHSRTLWGEKKKSNGRVLFHRIALTGEVHIWPEVWDVLSKDVRLGFTQAGTRQLWQVFSSLRRVFLLPVWDSEEEWMIESAMFGLCNARCEGGPPKNKSSKKSGGVCGEIRDWLEQFGLNRLRITSSDLPRCVWSPSKQVGVLVEMIVWGWLLWY